MSGEPKTSQAQTISADICISGGGVVGGLAALLCAQARPDLAVVLLDANGPEQRDPRTLALAHTTLLTLQSAGIEPSRLVSEAAQIQHIHVSDRGGSGSTSLHAATYRLPMLGKVVSAQALQEAIVEACRAHANITWLTQTSLQSMQHTANNVVLQAQGQQPMTLNTQLLVAADGGHSLIRRHLKIARKEEDYAQTALIANVTLDRDHQGWAYERFTAHGPIAMLPRGPRQMALVWCVDSAESEYYTSLDDNSFLRTLQQEFGHRAGKFTLAEDRASYPLYLLLAERAVFHRTVLIGNACHTLHPIAGQGYNLGVRDCVALAELVAEQAAANSGVTHRVLLQYEQQRQQDYRTIAGLTDGLVKVFSNRHVPLVSGRNLGLLALRKYALLGYPLARAAMGYRNLLGER